jgi:hypothetical protein
LVVYSITVGGKDIREYAMAEVGFYPQGVAYLPTLAGITARSVLCTYYRREAETLGIAIKLSA